MDAGARMTQDLDLAFAATEDVVAATLQRAAAVEDDDRLTYRIERIRAARTQDLSSAHFRVETSLVNQLFVQFALDAGLADGLPSAPESLQGLDLNQPLGIPPVVIPTLPIANHIAEKV
jgi:hypothetical protein